MEQTDEATDKPTMKQTDEATMEVDYSGGCVLIFSYLILIHQLDNFGGLRVAKLEYTK